MGRAFGAAHAAAAVRRLLILMTMFLRQNISYKIRDKRRKRKKNGGKGGKRKMVKNERRKTEKETAERGWRNHVKFTIEKRPHARQNRARAKI